ncbi:hypothetical protein [Kitasatospora sp. NPDC018619]|uniref:hypothetical protein n=1 Tax=unclassified Kitasatospora TaxID=2633591 RepID=UPI0037BCD61D
MTPPSRLVFLGRTVLALVREPRTTWSWLWGGYLQFAPPVLWFSPRRRETVAAVARLLADERHLRETCTEAAWEALHAELAEATDRLRRATVLHALTRELAAPPRRRPAGSGSRPPNRRA